MGIPAQDYASVIGKSINKNIQQSSFINLTDIDYE
jgi:hypothetical protein